MNRKSIAIFLIGSLFLGTGSVLACEYKAGETKFEDYANCRYGSDAIEVIKLPEGSAWDQCIYKLEAFRPPKLLAVTRDEGGKEKASINSRDKIGNPCYLTKGACDQALKASGF